MPGGPVVISSGNLKCLRAAQEGSLHPLSIIWICPLCPNTELTVFTQQYKQQNTNPVKPGSGNHSFSEAFIPSFIATLLLIKCIHAMVQQVHKYHFKNQGLHLTHDMLFNEVSPTTAMEVLAVNWGSLLCTM